MCFFSSPKPATIPPPPVTPTPRDEANMAAQDALQKKRAAAVGRTSTISQPLGDTNFGQSVGFTKASSIGKLGSTGGGT